MKLGTLRASNGGTEAVVVGDDGIRRLSVPDVRALLEQPDWRARVDEVAARAPDDSLHDEDLAPVVPAPSKMICLGHNFRSHVREMGRELPEFPTLFAKVATALIGPRDPICLPANSDQVDWEAELGVVIGARTGPGDRDPHRAIAGYAVVNDVSVRDWQSRTLQWFQGKNFDRTTPVGPWMVTRDELANLAEVRIRCFVDDEPMQDAAAADFIFRPDEVVAYIASFMTLLPGDILSLGTAGGVGSARTPPRFLRPGETVRTVIDGVGELVNRCEVGSR